MFLINVLIVRQFHKSVGHDGLDSRYGRCINVGITSDDKRRSVQVAFVGAFDRFHQFVWFRGPATTPGGVVHSEEARHAEILSQTSDSTFKLLLYRLISLLFFLFFSSWIPLSSLSNRIVSVVTGDWNRILMILEYEEMRFGQSAAKWGVGWSSTGEGPVLCGGLQLKLNQPFKFIHKYIFSNCFCWYFRFRYHLIEIIFQ